MLFSYFTVNGLCDARSLAEMSIDSDRESFVESELDKDQEEVKLDVRHI